jgi:hypothetical protein
MTETTVTVENASVQPARFSKQALLVGGSLETVPVGGSLAPHERRTVPLSVFWICDSTSIESVGSYGWPAGSPIPKAKDSLGRDRLFVDPEGAVVEADENNNAGPSLVRPNGNYILPNSPRSDLVVTAGRAWMDGDLMRYEMTLKNVGVGTYRAACGSNGSSSQYVGNDVYRVEIDGKRDGMNSTFMATPFMFTPGLEKKVWDFIPLQKTNYGVADDGLAPGCHEIKFSVDEPKLAAESNECNNARVIYFATGGATCGADKQPSTPSTCMVSIPPPVAVKPVVPPPAPLQKTP